MARERSNRGEWEPEEWELQHHIQARQAQNADNQSLTEPAAHERAGRYILSDASDAGDQSADWSDQPTQPQRRVQARRDRPVQSSGTHPEWPLRTAATGAAASPLRRLLDAAHERQFSLGCGTLAALVLIVAALLAAFSNGRLPINAGPRDTQPSIQANPTQSTSPMPSVTPRPSPTATPVPTDTPIPTDTPVPTATPVPTESPVPTQTPNPLPTETPLPTAAPSPAQGPLATPAPSGPTVAPASSVAP